MNVAWIPAGTWTLTAALDGFDPLTRTLTIKAGRDTELDVELKKQGADSPVGAPTEAPETAQPAEPARAAADPEPEPAGAQSDSEAPPAAASDTGGGISGLAWAGLGVGAAGAAAAVIFGTLSSGAEEDRDGKKAEMRSTGRNLREDIESLDEEARQQALLSNVSWGLAALGAGAGVWFLLTGDSEVVARPGWVGVRSRW